MNCAVFVTARTASTRLPKKALTNLYGSTTVIEHILRRAKLAKTANLVILCTTLESDDDVLCNIAELNGVQYFRGSTEDKLERWNEAAKRFNIAQIVTMDGDDPFCDPHLVEMGFEQLTSRNLDFIESTQVVTGGFTYGFTSSALNRVCEIKDSNNTEMMWTYFKDTGLFRIGSLLDIESSLIREDIRLTLDYPEDLELFRIIFASIEGNENISLREVVSLLAGDEKLRLTNYFRQSDLPHSLVTYL
jgi:spore coat polysaccharide biosynthesis protein SpsF (cytidylyltransferase family)